MLVDYHLHTLFSRHAVGSIEDYLARAMRLGIEEVCFTEHISREYLPDSVRNQIRWTWMQIGELAPYLDKLRSVQRFSSIRIRKGLEADYFSGYESQLRQLLLAHDLDFVLGTIHFMPQYDMEYVSMVRDSAVQFLANYFEYAKRAVESKLFDSVAHLNLSWQTVEWPKATSEARLVEDGLVGVVAAAKKSNVCLEVNTRAFNFEGYGSAERYNFFLSLISDFGVPVTIGSDAHAPGELGRNYPQMLKSLHRYGIGQVAVFQGRKRSMIPLGDSLAARDA